MKAILIVTLALVVIVYAGPIQKCELIDKDVICQCQGYNLTHFPNDRFSSQSRAKIQFAQFQNLIRTNCSPFLVTFLCSRYFPPCSPDWHNIDYILPCRELCEKVRSDCEPILQQYGAKWSQELSCGTLQSINTTRSSGIPCISTESASTGNTNDEECSVEKCVDIEHEKGKSASYKTFFPNAVTTSQADAKEKLNKVLKNKCSLEAEQFFILSHYPPCTEANGTVHLVYPCKQLCRKVKKECEKQLGGKIAWPDYMDCRKLSKDNCMDDDVSSYFVKPSPSPTTSTSSVATLPTSTPTAKPLETCEKFIETSCDELNNYPDLPKVTFPEYKSTFAQYAKFLNTSCSMWLKPFLCYAAFSAYKGTDSSKRVKPCRNICRKAETECSGCLAKLGLTWSDHWDCRDFQVKKDCYGVNDLSNYSSSQNNKFDSSSCPATNNDKVCTP